MKSGISGDVAELAARVVVQDDDALPVVLSVAAQSSP